MDKMTIDSKRHPGAAMLACGGLLTAAIAVFAVALMSLPALGAEPKLFNTLPGKPRLANLEIEIWPEYDRPAALILLKGELSAGGQAISLRLPASSGGPSAVAQTSTAGGKLLDLPFERTNAKDFITLRIQPPDRFFHVEYYDTLDTGKGKREFRYQWLGDLAVDRLSVHVQQPSASVGFAITPEFTDSVTGNDTLIYWTKDMGAAPAGKALPITIRYTKSDARTSRELLGPIASPVTDPTATLPPVSGLSTSDSALPGSADPLAYWIPAVIFALLGAVAAWFIWRRRRGAVAVSDGMSFCNQCGNLLAAADRFCSKCGTVVSGRGPA
jgi:hypothetical protein